MKEYIVCKKSDINLGEMLPVTIKGKSIVIIRTKNDFFQVVRDSCPHQGAPLSKGMLLNKVSSKKVGEFYEEESSCVLRCPWHSYEYDVETGFSLAEPNHLRMKTYQVKVKDNNVIVVM